MNDFYREDVLTRVKRLGIELIDVAEAFEGQEDPLAFYVLRDLSYSHFTAKGYRVAAETIRDRLLREESR